MDGETTMNSYLQDFMKDTSFDSSPEKLSFCPATDCFDCNICLDFAADPVVTLCGHLYCWPCIFRWLHLDTSPRHCPVCKSPISETSLVPLYGRGLDSKQHRDIPHRPRDHLNLPSPAIAQPPPAQRQDLHMYQNYHFYSNNDGMNHLGIVHSTAGAILGDIAFAVLPLMSRNNQNFSASRRNQRFTHEFLVKIWLHQLWLFLSCCALLCFVVF